MYVLLILLVISLIGLVVMLGRKLALVRNGHVIATEHDHQFVPDLEKLKHAARANTRRFGLIFLVVVIRGYVKGGNFIRRRWQALKSWLNNLGRKENGNGAEREANKILKMISEYKSRVGEIKDQIVEEEKIK